MMTLHEAKEALCFDTLDDHGTFTQLRLGVDPGKDRVLRLRLALRVLWRHWKSQEVLPYEIASSAGMMLHFREEALHNLRQAGHPLRQELITNELPDLCQGAFDLLTGSFADTWSVVRKDLGEG